jgi:hypothetical protein
MPRALPTLPPVTDQHRLQAFQAMRWHGWTYEQAMADPIRARLVECRAHQLRKQQWQQARRQQRWTRTPWPTPKTAARPAAQDMKRAAAGDRDD